MALKAVAFRIIVRPDPVVEEKVGSIVIAKLDSNSMLKAATTVGTIVDIGEDAWAAHRPKTQFAGLKVGDRVFYAKYAGKMIQETKDGEEVLVLIDEDIVAKVEESE